jgi:phage terminase large subunit GpA-like protein
MLRPIVRMTAAALVAGAVALAVSVAPAAQDVAPPQIQNAVQQQPAYARADRLRVPLKGAACGEHGWPAFEPTCPSDVRAPAGEGRAVAIVAFR